MSFSWPTGRFVLRLHTDPSRVATPDAGKLALADYQGEEEQHWYAEAFRDDLVRIRNARSGQYITAMNAPFGATVNITLRALFNERDGGVVRRQAWRGIEQAGGTRFLLVNDLTGRALGRTEDHLVPEQTSGRSDARCTAWVTPTELAPQPAVPGEPIDESAERPAPNTGIVRRPATRYTRKVRAVDIFDHNSFVPMEDDPLPPGLTIERFVFDECAAGAEYGLDGKVWVEGLGPREVRKKFYRVDAEPAYYVDGDQVDVNHVPPKPVARLKMGTSLYDRIGGTTTIVKTPYQLPVGTEFLAFTERFEGEFSRRQDGAGATLSWTRQWMGDLDTTWKVFVQVRGRHYIDAEDLTWLQEA
ncbi:RICIN domain-containing protein [Streptomyces sp. NRRL S-495]|uniref:RICIN domain-containing protein n=1 Tax=Streptomyces sp. NRRL S-495 TaxID=1609133 RepID=UPI0005F98BA9|nr:RICIN domain-containing protein [Streptomyces sp. NRRL S-495]KJY27675.1 hypothetical protein VR45_34255 [Streptomyces sp. NRRL S-495]